MHRPDWPWLPRANLATKLLLSYLVVLAAGLATMFAAARAAGPGIFAAHMGRMMGGGRGMPGGMMGGPDGALDAAFRDALTQALLVATGLAMLVALLVSLVVARQIARPMGRMLVGTRRIAAGHYAERVPVEPANAGDELGALAASFNAMAGALERTERRRVELLGDVAHELRTPIATLEGYLEGLLDGVVEPSARTWATLHDEAGRLRRLVDDLQELSRAEAHQLPLTVQPLSPRAIIAATVERLCPQFEDKGLALRVHLPGDLPTVLADRDRAAQVLANLLTNALRYTPAGGEVEVSAARSGDEVVVSVRDSGVGFPPESAPQLFERFYRVDKSRSRALGGSGIGLTIARALVEAMGGHIRAESPGPGRGSTFAFTLPVVR